MNVNEELKKYIENNIFPIYANNDLGHNLEHIKYVIERSLRFAKQVDGINYDMVYTIAAYHDIGHYIDAKNHEKVSSELFLKDETLKTFFTLDERKIMADAIFDHRASIKGEPRTIYGKIVSSADRNTSIYLPLQRTYQYRIIHSKNNSLEQIIEESRLHLLDKFGNNGYAVEKMYFDDGDYVQFCKDMTDLALDKEKFKQKYLEINNLKMV